MEEDSPKSMTVPKASSRDSLFYLGIFIIWDIYLFYSLQTPVSAASSIHLSSNALALIRLSIALPYLLIWLAGAFAYKKVKSYALVIQGSTEAPAFNKMALGILVLLISLIVTTIIGLLKGYVDPSSSIEVPLTIVSNYSYILPYAASFLLIYYGVQALLKRDKPPKTWTPGFIAAITLLAVFAYFWLDFIFSNPTRQVGAAGFPASYYLNDSLIILTIVTPAFISWVLGLRAVVGLRHYYKDISGYIYKKALALLIRGILAVILGSIVIQALLALGSGRLLALGLAKLLGVIYIFVVIQMIGFIYVARGAEKLAKIEKA